MDIDSTDVHQHALLEKVFGFHPLAIEDTLSPGSRVKLEEYDRYIFVVMSGIRFDRATPDPFDLETFKLYFFLGKNFLVTVHAVESPSCDTTRDRLMRNPDLLGRGAEMTMHSIIDQSVDAYFPMVETLNDQVDQLEERLFESFDEKLIHEIFKAKRSAFGAAAAHRAAAGGVERPHQPAVGLHPRRDPAVLPGCVRPHHPHHGIGGHDARPAGRRARDLPVADVESHEPRDEAALDRRPRSRCR